MEQANVMLAYPIDEAETLLTSKLQAARQSLSNCEEDLDFLREQITVTQIPAIVDSSELLLTWIDHGGGSRQGIQLGCGAKAQGKRGRR